MIWRIHNSHVDMHTRCQWQFLYRYVENRIIPPAWVMIAGTGTHKSAERSMGQKIATGTLPPLEECQDVARDTVVQAFAEDVLITEEELSEKPKEGWRDEAIDRAVYLSAVHRTKLAPVLQPTAVEKYWEADIKGYDYGLAGTIDILEQGALRDLKTKGKTPPKDEADASSQLTFYALGSYATEHVMPAALYLDCLIDGKPDPVILPTTRTLDDLRAMLDRVALIVRQIETGIFVPNPTGWQCSPRWCGYWNICPHARGRKVVSNER